MEPPSATDKLRLEIPDKYNKDIVSVQLSYLRSFLIQNKFRVKDIEYVSVDWELDWDKDSDTPETSFRRIPILIVYYNYNSSHR